MKRLQIALVLISTALAPSCAVNATPATELNVADYVITAPPTTATTTTTTIVPQARVARTIPSIVVQPFALNVSSLSALLLERLDRYSNNLKRGDSVTCTSFSTNNSLGMVSRLNVQRARSVCKYLSVKVVGLKVKVISALVPIATVRSSSLGSDPDWQSLNLLRRVVVEARPGT